MRESNNSVIVILGFLFSLVSLFILPIVFMPIAIVFGLTCLYTNRVWEGIGIIIFAIFFGYLGAKSGGWGLGITFGGDTTRNLYK